VASSHEECLKILIGNKADWRIKHDRNKTPLDIVGYLSKYEAQKQHLCKEL
jgi:hypothetical protein